MREKKYLVAEEYIDTEFLFERYNMTTVEVDEWLEAHEYRESTLYTHSCPCGARRTCHDALKDRYPGEDTTGYWECSECGYELGDCDPPNFCPDCGLRVKE